MKDQYERFAQDRLGNVERELDEVRAQDGMNDDNGRVVLAGGDTGDAITVYDIPDDAYAAHLQTLHVYNSTGSDAEVKLYEQADTSVTNTGDSGNILRSVTMPVNDGEFFELEYEGEEFDVDGIAIESDQGGDLEAAVSVLLDTKEYEESASEQTATPSS